LDLTDLYVFAVGKSTIAFIASHALWRDVLETETLLSRGSDDPDQKYGHDIPSILSENRRGKIVIISADRLKDSESRRAVEQFAQFAGPVIHVSRSRALSFKYLRAGSRMTDSELQALDEDWSSTETSLMEMCTASFVNLNCLSAEDIYPPAYRPWEDMCPKSNIARPNGAHRVMSHMKRLEMDFIRLMRFVLGVYTNHVPMTAFRTYLLSLTYSDVSQAVPHIENLSIGVDCWELRVDLLAERSVESIAYQIALLRRHSDLPVYLTMRTRSQTGGLPDIKDDPQMIPYQQAVLSLGLKMGVEYVDVNITSPPETIASLVRNKGNSQIIISWHDMAGRVSWSGPEVRSIFDHACREGADIVMMIGYARDFQDNLSLRAYVQEMQSKHVPLIALNTGPEVSAKCRLDCEI
jgi:3-dehydroquinate dehydratase type I